MYTVGVSYCDCISFRRERGPHTNLGQPGRRIARLCVQPARVMVLRKVTATGRTGAGRRAGLGYIRLLAGPIAFRPSGTWLTARFGCRRLRSRRLNSTGSINCTLSYRARHAKNQFEDGLLDVYTFCFTSSPEWLMGAVVKRKGPETSALDADCLIGRHELV